jgi:hypothetical protein
MRAQRMAGRARIDAPGQQALRIPVEHFLEQAHATLLRNELQDAGTVDSRDQGRTSNCKRLSGK